MAEIHVQRKRRSLWWLWLLIIIVLAALVWYWYSNRSPGNDLSQSTDPVTLTALFASVKVQFLT